MWGIFKAREGGALMRNKGQDEKEGRMVGRKETGMLGEGDGQTKVIQPSRQGPQTSRQTLTADCISSGTKWKGT